MRSVRTGLFAIVLAALAACGGGGSDRAPGGGISNPPPPPTNSAPVVSVAIPRQHLIHRHEFYFDATQGGRTFRDPNGDPITYQLHPQIHGAPGIRIVDTHLEGKPSRTGAYGYYLTACDNYGLCSYYHEFVLDIARNAEPALSDPNVGYLFSAGAPIDIDATRGGRAFTDADGDAVSYSVEIVSPPRGLGVEGNRVVGRLAEVGAVLVRLTARDGYGGEGVEEFPVAVPAAETRVPTLPTEPFAYADEELALPYMFRISSEGVIPLWDTQPRHNRTSNAGAALGRVLFYDRRLSITNTASCGSCHEQSHGFTVPERFGTGVLGLPTSRNPMSLANARYNLRDQFFGDMRVATLERLALMPIRNPVELGTPLPMLIEELEQAGFYGPLFEAAFGTPEITKARVAQALAQFVRSLISYQTKYDRAHHSMDNEPMDPSLVMTAQELRGEEVFGDFGRGGCFTCHSREVQTMIDATNNGLDLVFTDPGMGGGGFRAPSLRNVAVTSPYMHDGRFATLRDVIEHYDHGVQDTENLDPRLRVQLYGPPIRLELSEEDKVALEAFLNTLTDEAFLVDPKFSDPFE